jgi:peptide deformylase
MALLDIILEGDPRLRQKATRIRTVDDGLRKLAADMFETMREAPGIGLAAPQVGVTLRLIVVHVPAGYRDEDDPEFSVTLVNPEIIRSNGREIDSEGCLSIPGWIGDVPRFDAITVKAMTLDNKAVRLKARGFPARVLQHEIDHLDGILFTDRVEDRSSLRMLTEEEDDEATVAAEPAAGIVAPRV